MKFVTMGVQMGKNSGREFLFTGRNLVAAAMLLSANFAVAGSVLKLNAGTFNTKSLEAQNEIGLSSSSAPQNWIVQFKNSIKESDKKSLEQKSFEVLGYLPDDAVVVRATKAKLDTLKLEMPQIQAVVAYEANFKLSKSFAPSSVFNADENQSLVIKTFKSEESAALAQKIQAMNKANRVLQNSGKVLVAIVPRSLVSSIAAFVEVEHIQPSVEMQPMHIRLDVADDSSATDNPTPSAGDYKDLAGDESGTKVMNFDSVWNQGYHGEGQIAGMSDTGLDSGAVDTIDMDFKDALKEGQVFGMFSKSWGDPMGHGTHVSGSIVGRGVRSGGIIKGGAYAAQYVAQGMWSPMMKNLTVPPKLTDMLSKAYASGVRVHSNSWGAARNFGVYDAYAQQVDEFMFNNPDMLILFAAGNSGVDANKDGRIDAGSMSSPGTAKNCLTVGASENVTKTGGIQVPLSKLRSAKDNWSAEPIYSSMLSDNANGVAMFSSRGPTADGRTKPEIVAPGTNILSNRSHDPEAEDLWGKYNDHYVWSGGTSMATPLTAGAATVARQILVAKFGVQNPSAALLKAVMVHTSTDMYPGQYGEGGAAAGQELLTRRPNSDEGYGRVNMENVSRINPAQTLLVDNTKGVAEGNTVVATVQVGGVGRLLANLVYTDAPASPNASTSLVNDLDLSVEKPDGTVVTSNDHINNNEIVELSNLPAGTYKVKVTGYKVPQGKAGAQPYALVVSTSK